MAWDGDDLVLAVRVQPNASKEAISGYGDGLKVHLSAPPVEGKANAQLIKLLAKRLGVAKSAVAIEQGESSKDKRIRVSGADPERAAALFKAAGLG